MLDCAIFLAFAFFASFSKIDFAMSHFMKQYEQYRNVDSSIRVRKQEYSDAELAEKGATCSSSFFFFPSFSFEFSLMKFFPTAFFHSF